MIFALFLLAFILRLIACITPAIWYDEAYSLHVASLPFGQIIALRDFTPPLWEIVLHPFVTLWHDVLMMRFVALAFSMLSMFIAYRIAREMQFTKAGTAVSLFLIAVLPGMTWMSSDGRGYAMLAALYLAGAWCVIKRKGLGLLAASALMLYTHVTAVFLIASLFAWALMLGTKVKPLVNIGLALVVLWLPWMYVMIGILTHPTTGSNPYAEMTLNYFVSQFAAAFWIGSPAWLFYLGFGLTALTIGAHPKPAALILSPIIGMMLVSLAGFTLITYRTISPVLMPFALMLGQSSRRWLVAMWMIAFVFCATSYQFNVKGSDQIQAARMLEETPARVVYATITTALPFDYYLQADDDCLLQLTPDASLISHQYDFDLSRCAPQDLTPPYWFILPDEPNIPPAAFDQMQGIAARGALKHEMRFLQTSPVGIYLIR